MRRVNLLAMMLLVPAFASCGQRAPDASAVRAEIAETWKQLEQAWEAGDAAASAAVFTEDAINMRPDAVDDRGRGAIEAVFSDFLSTTTVEDLTWTTQEVDVYAETAYELGTFAQTLQPQEGEPILHRGRYISVWKHQPDGTWRIHRFLFNDLPAGQQ